jgi:hypothetical protein
MPKGRKKTPSPVADEPLVSKVPNEIAQQSDKPRDDTVEVKDTSIDGVHEPSTAASPKALDRADPDDETISSETPKKSNWEGSERAKKIFCECGLPVTAGNKKPHEKSKAHLQILKVRAQCDQKLKDQQAVHDQKIKEMQTQVDQQMKQLEKENARKLKEVRMKDLTKQRLATIKKLTRQAAQLQKSVSELSVD